MYCTCAIVRNTSCAPDLVCVLQSQTDILLHAGIIFVEKGPNAVRAIET